MPLVLSLAVQAQRDLSSYYIMGCYSTNGALDGRYRHIKVQGEPDGEAGLSRRVFRIESVQTVSTPLIASGSCRSR